jgi:hypothetical protein
MVYKECTTCAGPASLRDLPECMSPPAPWHLKHCGVRISLYRRSLDDAVHVLGHFIWPIC